MKRVYYILVLLFISIALLSVYKFIPNENKFFLRADEGFYLKYSKYIYDHGIKGFPYLFREHARNQYNWIWPSPLRIGYFLLSSAWFKMSDPSFRSLATLSFICYIALLIISLYFSTVYFGENIASQFVLLLAFSPLAMAMGKRALTDSMGNMFIIISIWVFLRFLLSEKKFLNFIIFIFFYSYAVLVRELFFIFICYFCLVFLIYKYLYNNKRELSDTYLISIVLLPPALVFSAWFIFSRSFSDVKLLLNLHRTMPSLNQYSVLFCRGPWFRYIVDYILISPFVTILGLSFIIYAVTNRQILKDFKIFYFIVSALSVFLLLGNIDYTKDIRYVLSLDVFMRLFVIFMLKEIFKKSEKFAHFSFYVVLLLCLADYSNFIYLFCQKNIYDPVSYSLLQARLFIP